MPKVVPGYKEAARSKIVEAGFKIFSTRGYSGSTMDDIAKELGVSKGAIYLYFSGKEDLLAAIYKSGQESLRESLRSAFRGRDLSAGIEEAYRQLFEERQPHLRIMFEMTGLATYDERIRTTLKDNQEEYLSIVYELVREQARKGVIDGKTDTRLTAELLSALYTGLARMAVLGFPDSMLHRLWKESFSAILGLGSRESRPSGSPDPER